MLPAAAGAASAACAKRPDADSHGDQLQTPSGRTAPSAVSGGRGTKFTVAPAGLLRHLSFVDDGNGILCLGITDNYTVTPLQPQLTLSILPSLHIQVAKGHMSVEERLFLDTWTEKETEESSRLGRQKALREIEKGYDIAELRTFLQDREAQTLPEPEEAFLRTTQKQGRALKIVGKSLLIQCKVAEIAEMIATVMKELIFVCAPVSDTWSCGRNTTALVRSGDVAGTSPGALPSDRTDHSRFLLH